ncbi:MAG: hypothetical protein IPL60_18610 [Ardenticatenia bacterium]|nr:hypothetical protein [Ardenticatenia bacterium]
MSLAGRGDRLFLLSYRRGLGRDGSIEQNDLLVLRADESGGPILLQAQRVPGGDRARLKVASTGMARCCGRCSAGAWRPGIRRAWA